MLSKTPPSNRPLGWSVRIRHGRRHREVPVNTAKKPQRSSLTISRFERLLLERLATLEQHRAITHTPPKLEW